MSQLKRQKNKSTTPLSVRTLAQSWTLVGKHIQIERSCNLHLYVGRSFNKILTTQPFDSDEQMKTAIIMFITTAFVTEFIKKLTTRYKSSGDILTRAGGPRFSVAFGYSPYR